MAGSFTLDALGQISAVSTAGAVLWQADLTAGFDRGGGISGGGLAVAGQSVFATTGYGELIALDVESGAVRWRQRLNAGLGTPSVAGSAVYVVASDGSAWSIDAGNGRVRWNIPASPEGASLAGGAAPAITDRSVIFPFGSGELVSALSQSGVRIWGTSVAGARRGVAYNNLSDITADPVVLGGRLYAGNQSGRVVALDVASGARIWTASEGAYSPILIAGGSLFVSTSGFQARDFRVARKSNDAPFRRGRGASPRSRALAFRDGAHGRDLPEVFSAVRFDDHMRSRHQVQAVHGEVVFAASLEPHFGKSRHRSSATPSTRRWTRTWPSAAPAASRCSAHPASPNACAARAIFRLLPTTAPPAIIMDESLIKLRRERFPADGLVAGSRDGFFLVILKCSSQS